MDGFKIGELARLSGVPTGTIRFYERVGLLPSPPRTTSGYRKYSRESLERLQAVRRIKELGFSLGEVAELLETLDDRSPPCPDNHCRAAAKLHELDGRINELQRIKDTLLQMIHGCEVKDRKCTLLAAIAPVIGIAAPLTGTAGE